MLQSGSEEENKLGETNDRHLEYWRRGMEEDNINLQEQTNGNS
jgi:hypothetical protein